MSRTPSLEKIRRACRTLYISLLPLMIVTNLPAVGHKIQLADAAFLIWLTASLVAGRLRSMLQASHPLTTPLLGFFIVAFLATLTATSSAVAWVAWLGLLYVILLYHLVVYDIASWDEWKQAIQVWVWVSTAVAAIGILGVALGSLGVATPFATRVDGFYHVFHRPFWVATSTFLASPTPNMVYGYLHLGCFLSFGLLAASAGRARTAYAAACGLHLLAIAFSFSRGWVAGLLGLLVFLWPFKSNTARVASHALFAAWLAAAAAMGILSDWSIRDVRLTERPASPPSPEERQRYYPHLQAQVPITQVRLEATVGPFMRPFLRRAALQMWSERPVLGVGPGNFAHELYRRRVSGETSWSGLEVRGPWDAHSTYFGVLAEMGIAGFAVLLAVVGTGVWQITRAYQAAPPGHRMLVWALLSAVTGYLLLGVDDDLLTKRWWWMALSLGGSAFRLSMQSKGRNTDAAHR